MDEMPPSLLRIIENALLHTYRKLVKEEELGSQEAEDLDDSIFDTEDDEEASLATQQSQSDTEEEELAEDSEEEASEDSICVFEELHLLEKLATLASFMNTAIKGKGEEHLELEEVIDEICRVHEEISKYIQEPATVKASVKIVRGHGSHPSCHFCKF